MAAGSQAEKGIWALFVILSASSNKMAFADVMDALKIKPSITMKMQSPRRLVRAVIIPLPKDRRDL